MADDGLPEQICHTCFAQLNKTLKFIQKCRDSDTVLRQKTPTPNNDNKITLNTINSITFSSVSSSNSTEEIILKTDPGVDKNKQSEQHNQKNLTKCQTNNKHTCPQCNKELKTYSSLKYHLQLHSDKNTYLCSQCGASFKTKNSYDGHMATHESENPHECDICGKRYRQAASLRNHKMTHTGNKL